MFDLWRLTRRRRKTMRWAKKRYDQLIAMKAPQEQIEEHIQNDLSNQEVIDKAIQQLMFERLFDASQVLDIELPPFSDAQIWESDEDGKVRFTTKGRTLLRKLIDEEKARRFDVKTLWVMKLILPLIAALVGIIGALTGLFAVLQHKK
jgi:hypothetical protein